MRDALKRSMGEASFAEIREKFEKSIQSGDFIAVEKKSPSRVFTTERMIQYERDNVAEMQKAAVEQIVSARDKIMTLEGVAGAGKTTSLAAIREAAECEGYEVIALAPTSRAAQKLAESGIELDTLQRHLVQREAPTDGQKRLFVIDESSLASTKQMNEFFTAFKHPTARFWLAIHGNMRRWKLADHISSYKEAGMQTAKLDQILRLKDPMLKKTVEQLARGDVRGGVANLEQQGCVHEIVNFQERSAQLPASMHENRRLRRSMALTYTCCGSVALQFSSATFSLLDKPGGH
jgi:ATP-dependent exoDNAse (exonuclease V) alpha subunit